MRFKQQGSTVPEVNLVPMMDVLMSVLTFFIITSITLTGQRLANVNLPGAGEGVKSQEAEAFIVGLDDRGQVVIEGQTASEGELAEQMRAYLARNPEGTVILKADRQLAYKEISQLLNQMSAIGGENVSLAIQRE